MRARSRGATGNGGSIGKETAAAVSGKLLKLKRAILAYLKAHPEAADTATGIKRWWLPPTLANVSSADVAAVLAAMVADGIMETRQLPGGHVIFAAVCSDFSRN
jgi:hypothetical protein